MIGPPLMAGALVRRSSPAGRATARSQARARCRRGKGPWPQMAASREPRPRTLGAGQKIMQGRVGFDLVCGWGVHLPGGAMGGGLAGDLPRAPFCWPFVRPWRPPACDRRAGRLWLCSRPRSSVQVSLVNGAAGRSAAGPLRQVSRSNPSFRLSANGAGDQPPRPAQAVTGWPPATWRS